MDTVGVYLYYWLSIVRRYIYTRVLGGIAVKLRSRRLHVFSIGLVVLGVSLVTTAMSGQSSQHKSSTQAKGAQGYKKQPRSTSQARINPNTPQNIGSWTAPATLCPSDGAVCTIGVFTSLLHTGKVLYYYRPPVGQSGSRAVLLDPISGTVTDIGVPFPRDIFCSGISTMDDGRVLVTGGDYPARANGTSGTYDTTIFDPDTSTWSEGTDMLYARWYPTTIELADGTMLEFVGTEEDGVTEANVVESYNYDSDKWTALPSSANAPVDVFKWYPGMTLLTNGKIFNATPGPNTDMLDLTTNTWSLVATNNYGPRYHGSHVLLPGLQRVMAVGGTSDDSIAGGGTATNTAEIIDFTSKTPTWTYTAPMTYARINTILVLLADGTVMAVGGGGGNGKYANPVMTPELYNPNTGKWNVLAPQAVQRTYHSTALLLPDGRVISAGSDNGGSQQNTYELYSPPYLFKGARPVISSAPTSLTYGQSFAIKTVNAPSIKHVALIRPGGVTHAIQFDQRWVELSFTTQKGKLTATAPADGNHAPPGYYMLVIINTNGVPSVMPFVLLNTGG